MKEKVHQLLEESYRTRVKNINLSIELSNEALAISRHLGQPGVTGKCLSQLSLFYMIKGEFEKATQLAEEAISQYESVGDEKGIADANYTIASVHYKTDNFHLGLKYMLSCAATYRKYNDYANLARTLKSVGTIYEFFNDRDKAIESYEASIDAAEKAGDLNLKSNVYNPLSGIYLNQQKINLSMAMIEQAIAIKKETGDERGIAFGYYGRGKIYTYLKDFEKAEKDFDLSLSIHRAMSEKLGEAMTLHKLGAMYFVKRDLPKAKDILLDALALADQYNIVMVKTKCNHLMYQLCKEEKKHEEALRYLEAYYSVQENIYYKQTLQIISSYDMLLKAESRLIEERMQQEKEEILEKKNKAEFKAKVKQDFLSNMSHEIRTPLNAVITITNLLNEKTEGEEKELVESLKFASNNLLNIINDILDFSRLEHEKVELEFMPVHLHTLLTNIKNTYISLAKEKGVDLLVKVDDKLSEAYNLDETRMSQILGNLISNAIKFTEKGSVQIKVEAIDTHPVKHIVRFKVIDTGIGIPEYFVTEMFDAFTQPKGFTTKKQGGSGLGLAIVKKLVNLHGSQIYANSKLGEGSTFYFDLELDVVEENKKSKTANAAVQLKDMQVLLAEDNVINTMVATRLLSKWGVNTECAKNGLEAVEKAKSKKYDVILMDIHMPEMNGYDATAAIRKSENLNMATPIYALTADINASASSEYKDYFNGFLLKPIEVDNLYKALAEAN
jgi:signal transduction histidine kinase/CheY-like chemotaxis protein